MASSPFPFPSPLRPSLPKAWIPVLFGLCVICFESTPLMGGNRTGRWLTEIWPSILGQANTPFFGEVHHILRKIGHFTGYGTLGLLFRKAWYRSVRLYLGLLGSRLMVGASALAVSCVFLVGCMDEWHQSLIPGRTSTQTDVLIDTCGALVFNIAFWTIRARRRRALLRQQTLPTTLAIPAPRRTLPTRKVA